LIWTNGGADLEGGEVDFLCHGAYFLAQRESVTSKINRRSFDSPSQAEGYA
jgi:hypothetical protein